MAFKEFGTGSKIFHCYKSSCGPDPTHHKQFVISGAQIPSMASITSPGCMKQYVLSHNYTGLDIALLPAQTSTE